MVSLGFFATKQKYLNKIHISGISKFTFYLCIPAFLFLNMFQAELSQSININGLIVFYLPVLIIYALGFFINKLCSAKPDHNTSNAVYALGSSYSNTVLIGLPVVISAIGEHMMGSVFFIITFHSAILFAITFLFADKQQGTRFSWLNFTKSVVLNPVVFAISLGLLANALKITLPQQLLNGIKLIAEPALASALFVLGANLNFYKIANDWHLSAIASALKLLILPAVVFCFGHYILKIDKELLSVAVLLSASPLGVNAYLIATELKQHESTLASTVVLSTLLSVLTFSFWLTFLGLA